jgi:hypothetical protein
MFDGSLKYRQVYGSLSGGVVVGPTVGPVVLQANKSSNWTIYLQRLTIQVATPGFEGSYWLVRDSTGVQLTGQIPTDHASVTPGIPFSLDVNFGAQGVPLTAGADLVLEAIASDAHGTVTWDAYRKLSTTVDIYSNKE